jgi:hypothetical protein
MMAHCSDNANLEAGVGKLANGFSDRQVVVNLDPDYKKMEENSIGGTQVADCHL